MKSQVSIEYLILFGFIGLILASVSYLVFDYYEDYQISFTRTIASSIAKDLTTNAEKIYYFGEPSRTTIQITMPPNVLDMSVITNDPVFSGCTKCTELRMNLSFENQPLVVSSSRIKILPCNTSESTDSVSFPSNYFSEGDKEFQIIAHDNFTEICILT